MILSAVVSAVSGFAGVIAGCVVVGLFLLSLVDGSPGAIDE